jgi:hypothetical protein
MRFVAQLDCVGRKDWEYGLPRSVEPDSEDVGLDVEERLKNLG